VPLLAVVLAMAGCSGKQAPGYQGYAEGEFVHVASSVGGRLDRLLVTKGQRVPAGTPLFALESENEAAARRQARQQLSAAEAQLEDLRSGKRPQELDVIRAQLAQAVAEEKRSAADRDRDEALYKAEVIPRARLDETRARAVSDAARVRELRSQLDVASLSARGEQIKAQSANVAAARAALEQAEWKLHQKEVAAPSAALVFDVLYRLLRRRYPNVVYARNVTDVEDKIIKAARRNRCDLIVIASHGRRGISRLLLGSETSKVLAHSTIPVLVVR